MQVADTSFLYALFSKSDAFHSKARRAAAAADSIVVPSEGARAQVRLCLATYPEQPPPAEEVARLARLAPQRGNAEMTWRASEPGEDG